jgi:hypothetical protein
VTTMDIIFQSLDIDARSVERLVNISREVMQANGNTTHKYEIGLVTDTLSVAYDRLVYPPKDADKIHDTHNGMCWRPYKRPTVLWVKSRDNRESVVKTLTHEVAHSMTILGHHHTWRRAYSLLLPFFHQTLVRPLIGPPSMEFAHHIHSTVSQYYKPRETSKAERRAKRLQEEITHMAAMDRMWNKLSHRVADKNVTSLSTFSGHRLMTKSYMDLIRTNLEVKANTR